MSTEEKKPTYLVIGRLRRPHGTQGEIAMTVLTDFPDRIKPGKSVFVGADYVQYEIEEVRSHQSTLLICFKDIRTRTQAEEFRSLLVYTRSDLLPSLPEGEYYHHQLMGLHVFDESNKEIGVLSEILVTGSNDVYIIKPSEGKDILLPAIESVIISVDVENHKMVVSLPEWL